MSIALASVAKRWSWFLCLCRWYLSCCHCFVFSRHLSYLFLASRNLVALLFSAALIRTATSMSVSWPVIDRTVLRSSVLPVEAPARLILATMVACRVRISTSSILCAPIILVIVPSLPSCILRSSSSLNCSRSLSVPRQRAVRVRWWSNQAPGWRRWAAGHLGVRRMAHGG